MYKKRTIRLGDYDTAADGLWTLTGWKFPEPEVEQNLVNVPGRLLGPLDLSTALTDGQPVYGARPLTITLESSEGTREARTARISAMVNKLHGQRVNFVLPDHPLHYGTGRLHVETIYNDPAHASVQVTGTCEPWLYAKDETVVQLQATATAQTARLRNAGAMPVVPLFPWFLASIPGPWALAPTSCPTWRCCQVIMLLPTAAPARQKSPTGRRC